MVFSRRKFCGLVALAAPAVSRAASLMNPAYVASLRKAVAAAGPNVWYDTTTTLDGWFGIAAAFMEWDDVTFAQAGTATKLRARLRGGASDQTAKLALYSNAGALLGSGVTGTIPASSGEAWYEITFGSGIAVTATTYKLAVCASGNIEIRTQTVGVGNFASQAYAGFPPATLPAPDGSAGSTFVIGAFVA